jgi:hypothetical protein
MLTWQRHRGAAHRNGGNPMSLTIRSHLAAAAAGTLTVALAACGGPAGPQAPSPSAHATPAPQPPASSGPAATPRQTPSQFAYLPLFPFSSPAQVRSWQASYASGGHQPWHLSATRTALAFTAWLGFRDINRVTSRTGDRHDAHVAVGLTLPDGRASTAAIVHLVRYGSGRYVPWEVAGTDDTTLTLDTPAYGATVRSPVRAGGSITGVDENLRAEVHVAGSPTAVGSYCCLPAGGQHHPWSLTVPFHAPSGSVLTIVVHTGGHVAAVERFAVTGVRAG